jgi:hypothetical protein
MIIIVLSGDARHGFDEVGWIIFIIVLWLSRLVKQVFSRVIPDPIPIFSFLALTWYLIPREQ